MSEREICTPVHPPQGSPHKSTDKEERSFEHSTGAEAYQLIAKYFKSYQPEEFGCLASAKASNEDNYIMQKFVRIVLKTNSIDHCANCVIHPQFPRSLKYSARVP